MSLTVAGIVSDVVGRLRGRLAFVGLSVVKDATNPDLVPAVRDALSYLGITPADLSTVTDADLANVTGPRNAKILRDAATLESLYLVRGAMQFVDEQVGENSQKLHQFETDIDAAIADYESRLPKPNVPAGSLGLMAQAPIPNDPFRCGSQTQPWTWPYPAPTPATFSGGSFWP